MAISLPFGDSLPSRAAGNRPKISSAGGAGGVAAVVAAVAVAATVGGADSASAPQQYASRASIALPRARVEVAKLMLPQLSGIFLWRPVVR